MEGGDRCRQLCLKLVTMLNRLDGRCRECQGRLSAHHALTRLMCAPWDMQREAGGNAFSGSGNGQKTRKRIAPMSSATNMHELGRTFVEEVLDVREAQTSTEEETAKGHHLQFKCQIRGWQQEARARIKTVSIRYGFQSDSP